MVKFTTFNLTLLCISIIILLHNFLEASVISFNTNNGVMVRYEETNYYGNKVAPASNKNGSTTRVLTESTTQETIANMVSAVQDKMQNGYPGDVIVGCENRFFTTEVEAYNKEQVKQSHSEYYDAVMNSGVDTSCVKSFKSVPNIGFMIVTFNNDSSTECMTNFATQMWEVKPDSVWFMQQAGTVEMGDYKDGGFVEYNTEFDSNTAPHTAPPYSPFFVPCPPGNSEIATSDQYIPPHGQFRRQWAHWNGYNTDYDMDSTYYWKEIQSNPQGESVAVAVIDSGVDITLPEIAAAMWTNPGEIPDDGIDNDGNGFIDDVHGWNFNTNTNVIEDNDDPQVKHGTHCAGSVAGRTSTNIISGISQTAVIVAMPALWPAKYGNRNPISPVISAIDYTIEMGIKVSSNSWGAIGGGNSENEVPFMYTFQRVEEEGQIFVTSAGNDAYYVPDHDIIAGGFDNPNVISVGNYQADGYVSRSSNYGAPDVDVFAPGTCIFSSYSTTEGRYYTGTSMSCPFVAGMAAEIVSQFPHMTAAMVKDSIVQSCDIINTQIMPTNTSVCGGNANMMSAYNYAKNNYPAPFATA